MTSRVSGFPWVLLVIGAGLLPPRLSAAMFRVATYNLENYLDQPTESRPHTKSAEARAKIRESLRAVRPDVVALQELGQPGALLELREALRSEGADFPYWEYTAGFDTNIHVAVLSRFPLLHVRPHTNETYLLGGRRFHLSRGIAEADVQVTPACSFTLLVVHLKSKRPVPEADESEQRLQEARVLRRIIEAKLQANPRANLIVAGDFNDNKDSPTLQAVIGRGRFRLVDTRPAERNGDTGHRPDSAFDARRITWTHYYGKEDSYCRIDYILLSPGMAGAWVPKESYVLALPDWGIGSDHRPVVACFRTSDE